MSIRMRRLTRDYEKVLAELAGSKFAKVEVVSGSPPSSYRVTYQLWGLRWDDASRCAKAAEKHIVDIFLPLGYPKIQPHCTMRTPVWHPNIGDYVCIGDFWSPGVPLVDIIVHIGDMIQYKNYNLHSPVNKDAAVWATGQTNSFPIGDRHILPPENGNSVAIMPATRVRNEVEIELGPTRERH